MLDSDVWTTALFVDKDGGQGMTAQHDHPGLDITNIKQLLLGLMPTANVTRATRASLAPAYDVRA